MTESEVLKIFENEVIILDCWIEHCKDIIADCETEEDEFDDDKERAELSLRDYTERKEAFDVAISALKEIHLYKNNKLCLVPEDVYSRQCSELDAYKEIGTVEECQEAVEKLDKAEKALNILLSGNYNNECNFCVHNGNPMANCQCICGDGSWCIHNAKWNGKTSDDEDLEVRKMKIHKLKLNAKYYEDSERGIKTFEIRKNDRDYKIGDALELREYIEDIRGLGYYTGNVHWKIITYILDDDLYLAPGYVCLGLSPIAEPEQEDAE